MKSQIYVVENIAIEVFTKNIRHAYLRADTKTGKLTMSVPGQFKSEDIYRILTQKKDWIAKHSQLVQTTPLETASEYERLQRINIWGSWQPYAVCIIPSSQKEMVRMSQDGVILYVRAQSSTVRRESLLEQWKKEQLRSELAKILPLYEAKIGVEPKVWTFRKMTSRWGSCIPAKQKICLNTLLLHKPSECFVYVVVHELTHLLEQSHNKVFWSYVALFYPQYKQARALLRMQ
ncbi:MAG: M48 family metallopeptidase [Lachnospiraceae bacterium]